MHNGPRIQSCGTKNTLLEGKQSNGTLKRKDISFLNDDVISLFFLLHCIFAIEQGVFCTM